MCNICKKSLELAMEGRFEESLAWVQLQPTPDESSITEFMTSYRNHMADLTNQINRIIQESKVEELGSGYTNNVRSLKGV